MIYFNNIYLTPESALFLLTIYQAANINYKYKRLFKCIVDQGFAYILDFNTY